MTHEFDRDYWQRHWHDTRRHASRADPPNPHLVRETDALTPGTALDAGCGEGAEALWLASLGWQVTAVDIAAQALADAAERAAKQGVVDQVHWVEADLTAWEPDQHFDLVTTHYAHPTVPQLAFYQRISDWVAPGGTLLIVGHLPEHGDHAHHPPAEATATLADITAGLDRSRWNVITAEEHQRVVDVPDGPAVALHDVVVRAQRLTRKAAG